MERPDDDEVLPKVSKSGRELVAGRSIRLSRNPGGMPRQATINPPTNCRLLLEKEEENY